MKSHVLLAVAFTSTLIASAQEDSSPDYFLRLGAGLSLVEDIDGVADSGEDIALSLNPGIRIDVAPGVNLNRYVGFEFNTGFTWNTIDEVESDSASVSVEGDLFQVPILANVVLQYPTDLGFTPFVGGGGGAVLTLLSVDQVDELEVDDRGDNFVGAFQLFGGASYQLAEKMNVGLIYKYMHVFSEDEDVTHGGEGLSDITTHSFGAFVRLEF